EPDETVVLQLAPPPSGVAVTYLIGVPSNAVVTIQDNDTSATNRPPFVHLNSPQEGAVLVGPTNIYLAAYAQDAEDGYNLKVEFFEGTNSLGLGTFVPALCPAPYCP